MTKNIGLLPGKENAGYALGWLIQNRELDEDAFCAALLRIELGPLERLCAALARSPADRVRAVDQSLLQALINRRHYKGEVSGRVWLYTAALRACVPMGTIWKRARGDFARRVLMSFRSPLDPASHDGQLLQALGGAPGSVDVGDEFFAFLTYSLDLTGEEIAALLGLSDSDVATRLDAILAKLAGHRESCTACRAAFDRTAELEAALRDRLHDLGAAAYSEEDLNAWRTSLLMRAGQERRGQRGRSALIQSAQALIFVVLALVGTLITANAWPPAFLRPEKALAQLPTRVQPAPLKTPSAAAPRLPSQPPKPTAGPQDISYPQEFARASNNGHIWRTLWADVRVIQYETAGIDSPARQELRKEVWIDLPDVSSRAIAGQADGAPELTFSVIGRMADVVNFKNGGRFRGMAPYPVPDGDLRALFLPDDLFANGGRFESAGNDEIVAGRPAAVLDKMETGKRVSRYWIDRRYGAILRRVDYGGSNFQEIVSDRQVTSIYFDVDLPSAIFQTAQFRGTHFVHDPYGTPEIPDYGKLLASWPKSRATDVENSPGIPDHNGEPALQNPQTGVSDGSARAIVDLFSGTHSSQVLACQRSPDSQKIAYASVPVDASGNTALVVADRASLQTAHAVLPDGITAGDFAFSPDSRRIAFFGCDRSTDFCGLFILDLASGKLSHSVELTYAENIIWNPDGSGLELVGEGNSSAVIQKNPSKNLLANEIIALQQDWHFLVIDAASGDLIYKRVFNWSHPGVPADSPSNQWGIPFISQSAGLEGCSSSRGF